MQKTIQRLLLSFAFMPIFAMPTTELNIIPLNVNSADNIAAQTIEDARLEKAAKIDAYYGRHKLPLTGYGMTMVLAAEKYGIDWNLIPAIAMRESTGGKFACYNNPFGWGSCKIKFASYDDAIEAVAKNLGGANKRTASYYAGTSTATKLYYYNGTVVPSYPSEVMKIMDRIDEMEVKVANTDTK